MGHWMKRIDREELENYGLALVLCGVISAR